MKKQKTILISLIIITLVAFTGCGNVKNDAAGNTSETTVQETTTAGETAAPETTPEETDKQTTTEAVTEPETEELSAAEIDPETFFQDYLDEPSVSEMYAAVADKFEAREYYDEETGLTIPYNFFIPEQAEQEACPMIMFIADSSVVGQDLSAPLKKGYGGIIWATDEEQAKHPSYVIVPEYPEIIIEDNANPPYVLDYVDATARMIEAVAEENNVDKDRLYTTGQSMGCMTSLYISSNYPDLFAAELFVSGQWDMDQLPYLDSQTFFYIACSGDSKSSGGQSDTMAMLDSMNVPYSWYDGWDPSLDDAGMEDILRAEIAEGNSKMLGRFEGLNHMSSFDYAYKLDAVRNWLFAQSKH